MNGGSGLIATGVFMLALIGIGIVGIVGWLAIELIRDLAKSPFFRFVFGLVGFVALALFLIIAGIVQNGHH